MTAKAMANQGRYKPGAQRTLTAKQAAFIEGYLKDFLFFARFGLWWVRARVPLDETRASERG
jgi:hypothetical protein